MSEYLPSPHVAPHPVPPLQEQSLKLEKLTGENSRLAEELREITGDDLPEVTSSKKATSSSTPSKAARASSSSPQNAAAAADDGTAAAAAAAPAPGAGGVGPSGDNPAHAGEFFFFFFLFPAEEGGLLLSFSLLSCFFVGCAHYACSRSLTPTSTLVRVVLLSQCVGHDYSSHLANVSNGNYEITQFSLRFTPRPPPHQDERQTPHALREGALTTVAPTYVLACWFPVWLIRHTAP